MESLVCMVTNLKRVAASQNKTFTSITKHHSWCLQPGWLPTTCEWQGQVTASSPVVVSPICWLSLLVTWSWTKYVQYIYIIYIIISFPTISLLPFFVIESMSEFLNGPSQFHQFLPLENYHQSWKCETEPSNETVFLFQPIKCHQKILRIQSDICKAFGHRRKPPPGTCKAPRMTYVCNVSLICLPGLCTTMTEKIVKTQH